MSCTKYVTIMIALCLPLAACSDDLPAGEEDFFIEAGGIAYTPDKVIRVANVNLFKGAFGETWEYTDGRKKKTDGRNFLWFLARQRYVPDIFTVQNLKHDKCGFHDCAAVKREFEEYLPQSVNYEFYYPSEPGGACVIYLSNRFERVRDSEKVFDGRLGDHCAQIGMKSVGIRLRDKKFHNAIVSVISVHMPPGNCTKRNTNELIDWADKGGADISIIAGDFNTNKPVEGREWGSIPRMKTAMKKHRYTTAKIWGKLDWIWRKGYKKVGYPTLVKYDWAMVAGYPSPMTRYSDHMGGYEDLTYQDKAGAVQEIAELPEQDSAPDDMPVLAELPEQDSAPNDMPALAESPEQDSAPDDATQCNGRPYPSP